MMVIFSHDNNIKLAGRKEPENGRIVVSLGQMYSGVIESLHIGLILVKGLDQDLDRLHEISIGCRH
jgi:hypothetical protein